MKVWKSRSRETRHVDLKMLSEQFENQRAYVERIGRKSETNADSLYLLCDLADGLARCATQLRHSEGRCLKAHTTSALSEKICICCGATLEDE